jgi:hypothetical protein
MSMREEPSLDALRAVREKPIRGYRSEDTLGQRTRVIAAALADDRDLVDLLAWIASIRNPAAPDAARD